MSDKVPRLNYDAAFAPAVQRGTLTPQTAAARGSRTNYIKELRVRYGFPQDVAEQVADGALGIAAARRVWEERQAKSATVAAAHRGEASSSGPGRMWRGLALVAAVVAAGFLVHRMMPGPGSVDGTTPTPAAASPLAQAEVLPPLPAPPRAAATPQTVSESHDGEGRLTLLSGPNPKAILSAFAGAWPPGAGQMTVVGIEDGPSATGRACRGVYLVRSGAHVERYAFAIRFDEASQAWVAGNGTEPIRSDTVMDGPAATTAR